MRNIRPTAHDHARYYARYCLAGVMAIAAMAFAPHSANAQRLENSVAVFAALDKVTAKIRRLEVPLNETVDFGTLKVTPHVCYSRPSTERPKTTSFVQISETKLDGSETKIFSGWMFAQSPGLNALEHPVFDVWLTGCEKPTNASASASTPQTGTSPDAQDGKASKPIARPRPRRRVRR